MTLQYNRRRLLRPCIIFITSICIILTIIIVSGYLLIYETHSKSNQLYVPVCSYSSKIAGNRIIFNDPSYSIYHFPEFICPQNFRNLADWIYGWGNDAFDERVQSNLDKYPLIVRKLPHGSIIYVKIYEIESFFTKIYPLLRNKVVLITGEGDPEAPGPFLHYLDDPNSKIIHWFGQNGNINESRSERFTHIPIGKNYACLNQDFANRVSRLSLKIIAK